MIAVIIAGGSGTRLWPLSQSTHPKHLLKLTGETSLLQNTFDRIRSLAETVYVITEESHASEVRLQLPELSPHQVIAEPARRGTASCLLLALASIQQHHPTDEPIVFLHSDHQIVNKAEFVRTVEAAAAASKSHALITLIGIAPTYPATGLGYIQISETVGNYDGLDIDTVKRFKEKPPLATAEQYLASGDYLWNLGLFAGSVDVFTATMKQDAPDLYIKYQEIVEVVANPAALTKTYLALPNLIIDYALTEKAQKLLVVPGTFDWADIGSFFDVHKILKGENRNALKGNVELIDCEDSMVHGYDKPIVAIGLSGIVVVDSPEGLLVCAKEKSQLVGEAAKRLQARKSSEPT